MNNQFTMTGSRSLSTAGAKSTTFGVAQKTTKSIVQNDTIYDDSLDIQYDVLVEKIDKDEVLETKTNEEDTIKWYEQTYTKKAVKNSVFYFVSGYADDVSNATLTYFFPKLGAQVAESSAAQSVIASLSKGLSSVAVGGSFGEDAFSGLVKKAGTSFAKKSTEFNLVKKGTLKTIDFGKKLFSKGIDADDETKKILKKVAEEQAKKVSKEEASKKAIEASQKKTLEMLKRQVEVDEYLGMDPKMNLMNFTFKTSFNEKMSLAEQGRTFEHKNWIFKKKGDVSAYTIKFNVKNFGVGVGIDYGFSVATSVITAMVMEKKDLGTAIKEDAHLGQNLLKSVWKQGCVVAFENLFSFAGPAGRKFGKLTGTVIGATVGDFVVNEMFDEDEGWCAAAGIATGITFAVGAVAVTAAIALGIISGPAIVVGAIACGVMVAALAVGTLAVYAAKKLWEAKDVIVNGVVEAWDTTTEFVSDVWDATTEFVSDAWDTTTEFVSDAWDETTEFVSDVAEGVSEFFGSEWYNPFAWGW